MVVPGFVASVNTNVMSQLFRRLVLTRLRKAEGSSNEFRDNLLTWVHLGFSVHAGPRIDPTGRCAARCREAKCVPRGRFPVVDRRACGRMKRGIGVRGRAGRRRAASDEHPHVRRESGAPPGEARLRRCRRSTQVAFVRIRDRGETYFCPRAAACRCHRGPRPFTWQLISSLPW